MAKAGMWFGCPEHRGALHASPLLADAKLENVLLNAIFDYLCIFWHNFSMPGHEHDMTKFYPASQSASDRGSMLCTFVYILQSYTDICWTKKFENCMVFFH